MTPVIATLNNDLFRLGSHSRDSKLFITVSLSTSDYYTKLKVTNVSEARGRFFSKTILLIEWKY